MKKTTSEWSKTYLFRPKDNLISHECLKAKHFKASYESDPCPPPMNLLLAWEYGRIWRTEHEEFVRRRKLSEQPKRVKKREYKRFARPVKNDKDKKFKKYNPKSLNVNCHQNDKKAEKTIKQERFERCPELEPELRGPNTTSELERMYALRRMAHGREVCDCESRHSFDNNQLLDMGPSFHRSFPPRRGFFMRDGFSTCCKMPGMENHCLYCSKPLERRFYM